MTKETVERTCVAGDGQAEEAEARDALAQGEMGAATAEDKVNVEGPTPGGIGLGKDAADDREADDGANAPGQVDKVDVKPALFTVPRAAWSS
ncbi:hypothetical protein VTI74DRAFT_1204 [Chaetomium olivicolor]